MRASPCRWSSKQKQGQQQPQYALYSKLSLSFLIHLVWLGEKTPQQSQSKSKRNRVNDSDASPSEDMVPVKKKPAAAPKRPSGLKRKPPVRQSTAHAPAHIPLESEAEEEVPAKSACTRGKAASPAGDEGDDEEDNMEEYDSDNMEEHDGEALQSMDEDEEDREGEGEEENGQNVTEYQAVWDRDNDDAISADLNHVSRHHCQTASVSSFADDMDLDPVSEFDNPDAEDTENIPRPSKKASGSKAPGKRALAVKSEQPHWNDEEAFTTPETKQQAHTYDKSSWPATTHLLMPLPGLQLQISKQLPRIRQVIQGSITSTLSDAYFKNPYPDGIELKANVNKDLIKTQSIRRFLVEQSAMGRMMNLHGEVKSDNITTVESIYGLFAKADSDNPTEGDPEIKATVAHLLDDNFHYGHNVDGDPIRHQPYLHPGIKAVIKKSFGRLLILKKYGMRFVSSLQDDPERKDELELPPAMVALAATLVESILRNWHTGISVPTTFDASVNLATFKFYMDDLAKLQTQTKKGYHRLLHKLYQHAFSKTPNNIQVDANKRVSLIDYSRMEE
ncbi:hypothetical protein C8J56DRAFT_1050332 [Mycena floridula]|nr:hypothetical protein C8J56DRAFT_1050332 [Mycena floridula]